jgi:phosphoenolpyruvate carboxylase
VVVPAPRMYDQDKVERDRAFLLGCFTEVLEGLGEPALAAALPAADGAAPASVSGDTERVAQAYSIAFRLFSLAEENAATQYRRRTETEHGLAHDSALWGRALGTLTAAGLDGPAIAASLPGIRVEPVFTAHPTEAKRATVLEQHRALYRLLVDRENPMWTAAERDAIRGEAKVMLERLWRSGEIFLEKPDVPSELRNVVHYLRSVLPGVLGRLDRRLDLAWEDAGLDPRLISGPQRRPVLSFGTWVGGDRDGHPFVTDAVTREALDTLRATALDLAREALDRLGARLSLSARLQHPPADLTGWIEERAAGLGAAGTAALERNPQEPWRQAVNLLVAGLPGDGTPSGASSSAEGLAADLDRLSASLRAIGADRLASHDVAPVTRIVRTFGFHLAALDIRQNSRFHDLALSQILAAGGVPDGANYPDWPEERRRAFLDAELASARPFTARRDPLGPEADAVLGCYRVLADEIDRHGTKGLGALIVSMTRSVSDLLAVYLFAREVGMLRPGSDGPVCPLPVVPLFETIDDLTDSPGILGEFLDHPMTRRSLSARAGEDRPVQQVMVGYSDSNKDGGITASLWAVHRALETLTAVGEGAGMRIRFFHGRGGTISRGAGPTHRFLRALPPGSAGGDVRLTEQGETIAQKYSNPLTATYQLEALLAGTTTSTLAPRTPRHALEPVMDRLAAASRDAYTGLVGMDGFIDFFGTATPIDVIEVSRIGSRPARRTGRRTLADLRAIPWVFAWSQARFFLSGWYGLGSALEWLETDDPEAFADLLGAVFDWPALHYIVSNSATSVVTADTAIMREYAALVPDATVRDAVLDRIVDEHARTVGYLQRIYQGPLAERRPNVEAILAPRRAGLAALHRHQIEQLAGWRRHRGDGEAEEMVPPLLVTVNAIAAGLGMTG